MNLYVFNLEAHDEAIFRSTLNVLGDELVQDRAQADYVVVDMTRLEDMRQLAGWSRERLIFVGAASDALPGVPSVLYLPKPVRSPQIMKLMGQLALSLPGKPALTEQSRTQSQVGAPATRQALTSLMIRLTRMPDLAHYPVSLELMGCIEMLSHSAVAYAALLQALPEDREMLDAILNDAARKGYVQDAAGNPLGAIFGDE